MGHWIGIDVGKTFHWASVLDDEGREVLSRKVFANEEDIETFRSQVRALGAERAFFCVDMMGGPATLLEAVLQGHGERVFYLSGTALNRARDAYAGGERKSDPRDARVIADQLRMRWRALPQTNPRDEAAAEMRALLAHCRNLVQDQVRRITRMRGLLVETFPGLEAILDLTKDGALVAVAKVATPGAARRLGETRLARWLKARGVRKAEELARRVVEAAKAQRHKLPAAELKAELVAELASEVLRTKGRLAALHERLEELVSASPCGRR